MRASKRVQTPKLWALGLEENVYLARNPHPIARAETARLWEVASGRLLRTLKGHSDQVTSVAFSPDSGQLASADGDKTVRRWEVASGRLLPI